MTSPFEYDAIVAGAGPVGLFLACELALARCRVLVLDKAADPHGPLKAAPFGIRGLSAPTIEALDRRGLLDPLESPRRLGNPFAVPAAGRRPAGHFAGLPFHHDDIDPRRWPYRLPDATPPSLAIELGELETLLARRAQALGVDIVRGHAVDACEQDADGVRVAAGGRRYAGRWLVGCDGARSAVRKLAGFTFAGTEPTFTGYSARADVSGGAALQQGRVVTPHGMYFQSRPGYFNLQDVDGGAFHDAGQPVTREHFQQVLRRLSGSAITVGQLHLATTWTDRARQATRYRDRRILLAGDAAHIHAPLGGQGLNLGIGDAMNLGWKLAAVLHGRATDALLDSYHAERHPVGAQVLDWSRAQVEAMRPDAAGRALRGIFRDLLDTRDGATYAAGRVWGVDLRYQFDAGPDEPHPLLGRSVPAVACDDGSAVAMALRDGRGLVLDSGADLALRDWADSEGTTLRYAACAQLRQFDIDALLVRPDGIVATVDAGVRDAARRWGLAV